MNRPERLLRVIALVIALSAAGIAIASIKDHGDRSVIVMVFRAGFYAIFLLAFIRRAMGNRMSSLQWVAWVFLSLWWGAESTATAGAVIYGLSALLAFLCAYIEALGRARDGDHL